MNRFKISSFPKEENMNKLFKTISILTVIISLITACGTRTVQPQPEDKATTYETILGKSLNDKHVIDFVASNDCSSAAEYRLCKDVGIAFWGDSDQIVKMVYLYSGNTSGFKRYRGQLPYGLSFYDPMWRVEEKLGTLETNDTSTPTLNPGLPDEASSPDHFHYWAIYQRLDMTIIYNIPARDEDAYIYAIVVHA